MTTPVAAAGPPAPAVVLALDPGRAKCGIAVVERGKGPNDKPRVLHREIVETERVVARILPFIAPHGIEIVLIGNATGGSALARALRAALPPGVPVQLVEEAFTSQRARSRYLREHQPRGLQRLLPPGLRTPPVPIDDYAALLLAEDFFAGSNSEPRPGGASPLPPPRP